MKRILVLCDFDGTITTDDSLIKFIRLVVGDFRFIIGLFFLSPVLFLYKIKLIPNYKAKEIMLSCFFKNYKEEEFIAIAKQYSLNHIDKILRPKAIEKLNWHKEENHKIVIVSASLDYWLRPWCEKNGYELIATKLEIINNKVTGKLASKNCFGEEKVKRINDRYKLSDYDYIYGYGDSRGDKEMLEITDKFLYKPFR